MRTLLLPAMASDYEGYVRLETGLGGGGLSK